MGVSPCLAGVYREYNPQPIFIAKNEVFCIACGHYHTVHTYLRPPARLMYNIDFMVIFDIGGPGACGALDS